jgi:uncharacterized membrane protein
MNIDTVSTALTLLVGLLHVVFALMEIALWTYGSGRAVTGYTQEKADVTQVCTSLYSAAKQLFETQLICV